MLRLTRKAFILVLRVLVVLLGFLIFWPVANAIAVVSWTKIVSLNASELSFATIQMMGLGETINYVYMGSTPTPYSGPSDIWLYFAGGLILLGFSWYYLQMG
jgi:hypothetical protein